MARVALLLEALGVEALGVEALGVEDLGVEALGVEDLGVEARREVSSDRILDWIFGVSAKKNKIRRN